MKKFMKGCAITALVLFLVGAVLAVVAGAVEGPAAIQNIVSTVTHDKVHVNLTDKDNWGITVDEEELFDVDDQVIFDEHQEIIQGNGEKKLLGLPTSYLDINVGGGTFLVCPSEDENMYVQAEDTSKMQCYIQDDTLYLKALKKGSDWKNKGCKVILYLPANARFEKVDANLGAGILEWDTLCATQTTLQVGAGRITVKQLQAEECQMKVGAGEIVTEQMNVANLEVKVGMGNAELAGSIRENVDADCSMGSIEMSLLGNQTDYNYDLQAAMGNVSIAGQEYSGLATEKYMDNDADKDINVKCAMGNVDINFQNQSE